jgi:hypothetical protein
VHADLSAMLGIWALVHCIRSVRLITTGNLLALVRTTYFTEKKHVVEVRQWQNNAPLHTATPHPSQTQQLKGAVAALPSAVVEASNATATAVAPHLGAAAP